MSTLTQVLLRPIPDTPRTRRYQQVLDQRLDALRQQWDPQRGLSNGRGVSLPHEQHPDFWDWPAARQAELITPAVKAVYDRNLGRFGTADLAVAAFCFRSPLSRHHGDQELVRYFAAGVRQHLGQTRADGLPGFAGFNGEGWAHGWDVEGLIYGCVFLADHLDADTLALARAGFTRAAARFDQLETTPQVIGSIGNQRLVYALGLYLYSQYLNEPTYGAHSERLLADALPKVLDASGQIIEQYGPCMHYSHTAFIYAWLNLMVRDQRTQDQRVANCLEWFCRRYTRSGYPFAGPSTRQWAEEVKEALVDLLPAAEQLASLNTAWRDRLDALALRLLPADAPRDGVMAGFRDHGHGSSIAMWAMLATPAEMPRQASSPAPTPGIYAYQSSEILKRAPFRYWHIHQPHYQTQFTSCDFLPFSGIQTWAWQDEPPLIHPTPLAPSSTQGDRLDTARQGVSHNWGMYGAGAMGIDSYEHKVDADNHAHLLVARYDWLWRVLVLTDRATVMLEFGANGPRRTLWTLNRVEPAEPTLSPQVVRFAGRAGCLHCSDSALPTVLPHPDQDDEWGRGVVQLRYDCAGGMQAFALSDERLKFLTAPSSTPPQLRFHDGAHAFALHLDPRLLAPRNPGNFSVDTYELAAGTRVLRG